MARVQGAAPSVDTATMPRNRRRILIAEDSPTQAEALRAVLEEGDYEVVIARNGDEALALVPQASPDLVLSDILMPGLDGFELCRALKRDPATRAIPVVLVTSLTDPLDVMRGLECGADNYITKPYEAEQLLARLRRVLGRGARADGASGAIDVTFLGERFTIASEKQQVLDLLISSFEELIRSNRALRASEEERARQLDRERTARADAEATSRRLGLLHRVSDAAVADAPLDDFLAAVLRLARDGLAADSATVLLLDDATQELVVHASLGLEAEVAAGTRVPVGRGISGAIARTGEATVVDDVAAAPEVASGILMERVRSMVGAPLVTAHAVLGVLHIGSHTPRHFGPGEVQLLHLIADRVALFIERARLNELERTARREAEEARARAEAANRAKSDFLAMMSHDLRTPLNAIAGYVELLEMGLRGPTTPEQLKDLGRIKHNQRLLLGLVNDLLNISRIERGQVPLNLHALDVAAVLKSVRAATEPQMNARGLRYEVRLPPEPLRVVADAERLEQILMNLVTNAMKFTAPEGRVRVSGTAEGERVRFAVVDTGIGIPADKLETIFDPFVQVDARRVGEQQGVGLGLSICRSLVQLMGGELVVDTEVGRGSTFSFALPRSAPGA